jgi:hypothetical protein
MNKIALVLVACTLFSLATFAQVGIGTATPNASAQLDVTSTTKGFLPPRMTSTQRAAITSPPTGLLVYQTNEVSGLYYYTGSLWTIVNASPCGYAIGQNNLILGGYIFYLDQSGCHGLVAATTDQSTGIQWYAGTNTNTTAFAGAVGGGEGNTNMIVYNQSGTLSTYAAGICYNLNTGGFSDWYLPSKYELNLMYMNIGQGASAPNTNVGGFANNFYWSSSEYNLGNAWGQFFSTGVQAYYGKNSGPPIRAVRAF